MKLMKRAKGGREPSSKYLVTISTEPSVSDDPRYVNTSNAIPSPASSLGTGNFSLDGSVERFVPSPHSGTVTENKECQYDENFLSSLIAESLTEQTSGEAENCKDNDDDPALEDSVGFRRSASSFLRVADLNMKEIADCSVHSGDSIPNFHRSSTDPPPGVPEDPAELWVAVDDGNQGHAPVAPAAIRALANTGLITALNEPMWTPDSKTAKILASKTVTEERSWETSTFTKGYCPCVSEHAEDHILVWSGKFHHNFYGNDLPAVRAAAVIHMSPDQLLNLLVDSSRVKEYNVMSLGRCDLLTLGKNCGGIVTKVMRSESRPPMLRKTLQFTSLLHACALDDASGYQIVSRAVSTTDQLSTNGSSSSVLVSEILLGVNLIRRIESCENKCLFVSVNHIRSPMVPMMIAKRIGLHAAVNFVQDLRRCCPT